jgi:hypothetical protein
MMSAVSFAPEGLGRYSVQGKHGRVLIAMFPGIPHTEGFIEVEERRNSSVAHKAVIFGPISTARSNRYRKIAWLSSRTAITALDEGELWRYLRSI